MQAEKGKRLAYAVLVLMPLFYSANLVIGRWAVTETGPWTLAFFRWLFAFALLAVFGAQSLMRHREALLREWRLVALLAFLGQVVCGGFVYWALKHTTATNATLIYTASPIVIVLLERWFGDERLSIRRWFGILVALTGVLVIIMHGDLARLMALEFNPGDAGVMIAAIAWAGYSVLLKRPMFREIPTLATFAAISGMGTVLLAPFMLVETLTAGGPPASPIAWASIVALAIVPSILAYGSYQYGVEKVGATTTGVFLYLLPAYGVLLAVLFLGETFAPYHAAGFACVMAGVVITTMPQLRRGRRG